jgi:hypothetical protein
MADRTRADFGLSVAVFPVNLSKIPIKNTFFSHYWMQDIISLSPVRVLEAMRVFGFIRHQTYTFQDKIP